MKFFAVYEDMELKEVGKLYGDFVTEFEITESEYNAILSEIREKAALVNQLYSGEITVDDVPTDWQEEIQRRVNERIAAEGEAAEQPVSGDEFLSMLEGVL
jgi:hypothetical protein